MTYTQLALEISLRPFASDQVSFVEAEIPAVLTIEGADSTNGNVHSDADTIDHRPDSKVVGPVILDSTVRSFVSRLPSYECGRLRQGEEC